ncbi:MAG: glycosyltransferase [Paludibacter sp.]|nr:glycosyltransferase [Paludibacter sp.]
MNILIAHMTWYPSGGDWTYIDSICKMYESHGHHIIPFSVKNEKNFPTPYDKYFLESVDYKSFYNKISLTSGIKTAINSIYSIEAKEKLSLLLRENKVDIAQLNSISNYQTPSIIPVLKKEKIPIVWRILDYRIICPNTTFFVDGKVCEACFKHKYYNCILNKCKKNSFMASTLLAIENYTYFLAPIYNDVDLFLFQSEFTRDIYVKYGYDIKKTHIIENSFDCSDVKPQYAGDNYILYFGRLEKEKGIYTLLDAMKLLPDIVLKVVGNGTEYEKCMNYIVQNSISNVIFLGPIWGKELDPLIENCEFVVVPSEWYDPSPYVVLQSFSYGKPVVAANMGGLNDLIINNENGLLFKAGDSVDLAQKISILINDKNLITKMGMSARSILENKYNPERYYKDTLSIFTNLINLNSNL